ncbi:MAG: adenylate/guanylate cyclase domain-containing protein [Xanthobacteraceae bacterium]
MKRKIAAILAADVVGYSKLVAEDEEETLRRLSSYRAVFDDFIARGSGRVFNTAGDAILAEFPSAVEAVRCAIDVQESLRTRNLAYPQSRQMSFRIGITIGDVVERDGDLLGDGVNIAARLEGLAKPGGLCVSRTVYEQVSNKMSVQFADIGEQEVKNIPSPVHAYTLTLGSDAGIASQPATPPRKAAVQATSKAIWPIAIAAASGAVIAVAAIIYLFVIRPSGSPPTNAGVPTQTPRADLAPERRQPPRPVRQVEALVPEAIPFITDRERAAIRSDYLAAPEHKALAISTARAAFTSGQKDDETAKTAALENCQRLLDTINSKARCDLYAVGDTVVYSRGRPPMPPEPWINRDPAIERPFAAKDVPLLNDNARASADNRYAQARGSKALVISPQGNITFYVRQASLDEAARRALESCGAGAGVPCLLVALDDQLVVPIPTSMKVVGLFHAVGNPLIAPDVRESVAQRLGNATNGWNAVAAGAGGRPGLALKAASEQAAVDGALADCARQDRNCRVIAIGPFAVEPN